MPLPALVPLATTAGSWVARSAAASFVLDKAADLLAPDDEDQQSDDVRGGYDPDRDFAQSQAGVVPSQVMYSGPEYDPDMVDTMQFDPNEVRAAQRAVQAQPVMEQQAAPVPASGFGVAAPSVATAAISSRQQDNHRDEASRQRMSDGIMSLGAAASSWVLGDLAQQKMEGLDTSGMNKSTVLLAGINAVTGAGAAAARGEDFAGVTSKMVAGAGSGAVTKLTFDGIQDADGGHFQSGVMGALGGVLNNFVGGNESSMLSSGMTGAMGALGTDIAHDMAAGAGHETTADALGVAGLTGLNTYTSTDSGLASGITAALGAGSAVVQSPSTDEPRAESMEME